MEFTAKQLAQVLRGTVDGDENATITKFAKIEHGKPGTLSFFANPKYEQYVYTSEASIILVDKTFEPKQPVKATLVRVDNAYSAVTELLKYAKDKTKKARRHRSLRARWHCSTKFGKKVWLAAFSSVGRRTVIGDRTVIHENVTIGDDCKIGKDCIIYPGVKIFPGMVIGDRVILHAGCVIGDDGFGNAPREDGSWEKIEHLGNVGIGDDVEIGTNTTVDRAQMESTIIGNGVRIDNLCQIAHNVVIGDHTVMAAQVGIAGHVKIADHTTILAQAGIVGSIKKEGQTLLGSPALQHQQFMRAYVKFRQGGQE